MAPVKKYILFPILAYSMMLLNLKGLAQTVVGASHPEQYGTPFANVPARQDVVIYQVNMRAFSKGGNFAGVTARLDSIKDLGINVIYLMPIYPVGIEKAVNSPYCIRNYTAINKEFGTLTDFRTLIDAAHSRNISVILDWVGNHTSWDHPWISAHKNWYKQDSAGNILTPGHGWNDVAQLDFSNPDMRLQMISDMKYWVYAANIDGFRCDYADGPPASFWKQAIDTLRSIHTHKLLFLAEGKRSENYAAGFDYNFGFRFFENLEAIYDSNRSVLSMDSLNTIDYIGARNGQGIVRYTTNHDVNGSDGTPLELFGGKKGSMTAFAIVTCMKGIPMIYNGQEVGMDQRIPFPFTSVKVNWTPDPEMTAAYKKIIALRKSSKAIKDGKLTTYSNKTVCAFTKTSGKETIFVIANTQNKSSDYQLPVAIAKNGWTNIMNSDQVQLNKTITLAPYTYIILKKG